MFACRLTRDTPSFKDELDIMKFICKDFWTKVFRRQVDNLRTNHQVKYCWKKSGSERRAMIKLNFIYGAEDSVKRDTAL